MELKLNLLSLG